MYVVTLGRYICECVVYTVIVHISWIYANMGETLASGAEAALVNRLRGRGRPKKTYPQKQELDSQPSVIEEEDILDYEKLSDDPAMMGSEGHEFELNSR